MKRPRSTQHRWHYANRKHWTFISGFRRWGGVRRRMCHVPEQHNVACARCSVLVVHVLFLFIYFFNVISLAGEEELVDECAICPSGTVSPVLGAPCQLCTLGSICTGGWAVEARPGFYIVSSVWRSMYESRSVCRCHKLCVLRSLAASLTVEQFRRTMSRTLYESWTVYMCHEPCVLRSRQYLHWRLGSWDEVWLLILCVLCCEVFMCHELCIWVTNYVYWRGMWAASALAVGQLRRAVLFISWVLWCYTERVCVCADWLLDVCE